MKKTSVPFDGPEHFRTILTEARGSEIILVARKQTSPDSEQLAD